MHRRARGDAIEKNIDGQFRGTSQTRIIALDIGTVRIGVAASDPLGTFAQGIAVLQMSGEWMDELSVIMNEYRAGKLVVGMPRRTDGSDGPEAVRMRSVIESLSERFTGIEIIPWDERFTTTIANQALIGADVSRKNRRGQVDKVAAALILQNYLDSLCGASRLVGPPAEFAEPVLDSRDAGRNKRKKKRAYD
ncbi:MAG: Holliday junction resolvase RuvX [Synergistaceae bacterium]|jgi:putative Holliday junction resolvase|nr:Holliday junction resolvase RuvX [Synergistaceae bacterium]